jgi:hypothetical protein
MIPYKLTFSVDLVRKVYCAYACDAASTYDINRVEPHLLTLADTEGGPQSRHMIFDRRQSKLEDTQVIKNNLGDVSRSATAVCTPAPFHPPSIK